MLSASVILLHVFISSRLIVGFANNGPSLVGLDHATTLATRRRRPPGSSPHRRILFICHFVSASRLLLHADFARMLSPKCRQSTAHSIFTVSLVTQSLQFALSIDRTAATQLLTRSIRDALSCIFDVTDPTWAVTLDSPAWVPCWHAPLLKLTEAAIHANRDDTHE